MNKQDTIHNPDPLNHSDGDCVQHCLVGLQGRLTSASLKTVCNQLAGFSLPANALALNPFATKKHSKRGAITPAAVPTPAVNVKKAKR